MLGAPSDTANFAFPDLQIRVAWVMLFALKKIPPKTTAILALLFDLSRVNAAPFVNLDFEMANTNTSRIEERFGNSMTEVGLFTFGSGPAADLFPGWVMRINGQPTNVVAIGNGYYGWPTPLAIPAHIALAPRGRYFTLGRPAMGNYSFRLDNSRSGGNFIPMDLTQTGDVPVNAKLLMIHVNGCLCDPVITINGQSFFWNTLGFYGSVERFVDVSAWAGQTVTLSISAFEEPGIVVDGLEFIGSDSLTIDPTLLQLQSDRFIITWLGELATKYQVESGTNTPPTWFPVGSPVTSTSRVFTFTDTTVTNQPNSQRFYRLRTVP